MSKLPVAVRRKAAIASIPRLLSTNDRKELLDAQGARGHQLAVQPSRRGIGDGRNEVANTGISPADMAKTLRKTASKSEKPKKRPTMAGINTKECYMRPESGGTLPGQGQLLKRNLPLKCSTG